MPRTPIPKDLIHRSEEVERNAKRFDYLCSVAEDVALPVVKQALMREFHETTASGAEILTNEAKQALQALAEDAAILQNLDEDEVLQELQRSLNQALPPPNEEESHQHTREFCQVLMSAWLETLRTAKSTTHKVELSDYLIPEEPSRVSRLINQFVSTKSKLPQGIIDAVASFAPNEDDIVVVLTTLCEKLFAAPRVVDLPFDLALVGAPAEIAIAVGVGARHSRSVGKSAARVMLMSHPLFISVLKERERQSLEQQQREREEAERKRQEEDRWKREVFADGSLGSPPLTELGTPVFSSASAQIAAANLCVPLPADTFRTFAALPGSLPSTRIEQKVKHAMERVARA